MGDKKGSWSTDVPMATVTSSIGTKHSRESEEIFKRKDADNSLLMNNGRIIECVNAELVEAIIDGTGSMGDLAKTLRDKSMRLVGQVNCQGYLKDPAFGLTVIGDANPSSWGGPSDKAPIQMTELVTNAESYRNLIPRLYLEGGGGGQGKENYDLALYGCARKIKFRGEKRKGFIFILGDEGFYDVIESKHLKKHFGEINPQPIKTSDIISELMQFFYVFCLHINTGSYNRDRYQEMQQQWRNVLGNNFIPLIDPTSYLDIMLGCIARQSKTRTIDSFVDQDLVEQKQTSERRELVRTTLREIDWQL